MNIGNIVPSLGDMPLLPVVISISTYNGTFIFRPSPSFTAPSTMPPIRSNVAALTNLAVHISNDPDLFSQFDWPHTDEFHGRTLTNGAEVDQSSHFTVQSTNFVDANGAKTDWSSPFLSMGVSITSH